MNAARLAHLITRNPLPFEEIIPYAQTDVRTPSGNTVLIWALAYKHFDAIRIMFERFGALTNFDSTILINQTQKNIWPLQAAIRVNAPLDIIANIIHLNPSSVYQFERYAFVTYEHFTSALHILVDPNHLQNNADARTIVDLILDAGAPVDQRSPTNGRYTTPIALATTYGNLLMVEHLLNRGADINQDDGHLLELAIEDVHLDIFMHLLDRGANPDRIRHHTALYEEGDNGEFEESFFIPARAYFEEIERQRAMVAIAPHRYVGEDAFMKRISEYLGR